MSCLYSAFESRSELRDFRRLEIFLAENEMKKIAFQSIRFTPKLLFIKCTYRYISVNVDFFGFRDGRMSFRPLPLDRRQRLTFSVVIGKLYIFVYEQNSNIM
jgi:hypothetical protein